MIDFYKKEEYSFCLLADNSSYMHADSVVVVVVDDDSLIIIVQ